MRIGADAQHLWIDEFDGAIVVAAGLRQGVMGLPKSQRRKSGNRDRGQTREMAVIRSDRAHCLSASFFNKTRHLIERAPPP